MLMAYRKPAVLMAGGLLYPTDPGGGYCAHCVFHDPCLQRDKMPALDISMIETLGRELHPPHTGLMSEAEVR